MGLSVKRVNPSALAYSWFKGRRDDGSRRQDAERVL